MRVIGFDPGYGITGWGVVEGVSTYRSPAYGAITTSPDQPLEKRLHEIHVRVVDLLKEFKPDHAVVEKLYFSKNRTTAEGVYESRGVILAAIGGSHTNLIELSPGSIKQAVAGSGRATKADVIRMVMRLLNINETIKPDDTSDALAGALAGIFTAESGDFLARVHGGDAS